MSVPSSRVKHSKPAGPLQKGQRGCTEMSINYCSLHHATFLFVIKFVKNEINVMEPIVTLQC